MAKIITPQNDDKSAAMIGQAANIGMKLFGNLKKGDTPKKPKDDKITRRMAGTHNLDGNKEKDQAKGEV